MNIDSLYLVFSLEKLKFDNLHETQTNLHLQFKLGPQYQICQHLKFQQDFPNKRICFAHCLGKKAEDIKFH
jgi:hypothetical protein